MKKVLCGIISLVVILLSISFTGNCITYAITNNEDIEDYYNSDHLIINSQYEITDYNNIIGNNVSYLFNNETSLDDTKRYNIKDDSTSDFIIEIIPSKYFFEEIESLEIGIEYGFYIKTTKEENYYFSKVLVFDIENI